MVSRLGFGMVLQAQIPDTRGSKSVEWLEEKQGFSWEKNQECWQGTRSASVAQGVVCADMGWGLQDSLRAPFKALFSLLGIHPNLLESFCPFLNEPAALLLLHSQPGMLNGKGQEGGDRNHSFGSAILLRRVP